MKKNIFTATILTIIITLFCKTMPAQNKAYVDKESYMFSVDQSRDADHKILGYENPDIKSKKLICISSFTADVENNPEKLILGSYYSTSDLKEGCSIYFISLTGNFAKLKFINSKMLETPFYIEKKYIDLSEINVIDAKQNIAAKSNVITCSQLENKNEDGGDPTIVKTCLFKIYKTVSTGMPDYKGRYSWQNELYKKENGKYVKVNNSSLFNQNKNQLLSTINQKIQKDYKEFSSDPETKDCFAGVTTPTFTFDQLLIDFSDTEINFSVTFGLSGACMYSARGYLCNGR